MARTNIPVTSLKFNAGVLQPAGTAVDQANGMNIAASGLEVESIPASQGANLLVLQVANTAASPFNLIIRAGVNPPAMRAALGDLTISITNATTQMVGPFEPGRFAQTDGSINVDFGVGFTGTVNAYLLDKAKF